MKGFIFNHEKFEKSLAGKLCRTNSFSTYINHVFNYKYDQDTGNHSYPKDKELRIVSSYKNHWERPVFLVEFEDSTATVFDAAKINARGEVLQSDVTLIGGVTDLLCAFIHRAFSHFRKVAIA